MILSAVLLVGGLAYWGWNLFSTQAVAALNEHPVIQRCIGKIEHSSFDLMATGNDPRDDAFAFHIRGKRGSGLVVAVFTTLDADHEQIDGGELHMDGGNTISLDAEDQEDEDAANSDSCQATSDNAPASVIATP